MIITQSELLTQMLISLSVLISLKGSEQTLVVLNLESRFYVAQVDTNYC